MTTKLKPGRARKSIYFEFWGHGELRSAERVYMGRFEDREVYTVILSFWDGSVMRLDGLTRDGLEKMKTTCDLT